VRFVRRQPEEQSMRFRQQQSEQAVESRQYTPQISLEFPEEVDVRRVFIPNRRPQMPPPNPPNK
jgi:hypothetical protein